MPIEMMHRNLLRLLIGGAWIPLAVCLHFWPSDPKEHLQTAILFGGEFLLFYLWSRFWLSTHLVVHARLNGLLWQALLIYGLCCLIGAIAMTNWMIADSPPSTAHFPLAFSFIISFVYLFAISLTQIPLAYLTMVVAFRWIRA